MPAQQAFNIGRDGATLNIVANGSPLKPTILTNFESSQESTNLKSRPLNGPPIFQEVPDGWKGSFDVDRGDSTLDDYFAQFEAGFYAGEDVTVISILHTIAAPAVGAVGALSQYLYSGVVLKLENAGSYKGDAKVEQKVSFMASTRTKVA
jgi:hypothetical protein